jgi:soluble lytic murein transglycosylase
MGTQKQALAMMIISTLIAGIPTVADASKSTSTARVAHAKQLLGSGYKHSVVRSGESVKDISDFVEAMTSEWLPAKYSKKSRSLATAIVRESEKYGFDPVFILAVIQNESRFNPEMRGNHTEIGLMQIKPSTAKWIGKKMHVRYKGEKSLLDPVQNVRLGMAFMALLRDQFDAHSPLYISAYNMGARRVREIVADDRMPKDYVMAVMKRYIAIYGAFAEGDTKNIETLSDRAAHNVLDITRSVASN